MKTTHKISCAILICLFFCAAAAKAQNFKTNESVANQLIQGTVPGLQYGPLAKKEELKSIPPPKYTQENYLQALFTGGIPTGNSAKSFSAARQSKTAQKPLASEGSLPSADQKKPAVAKMPPMQGVETKKTN